jgi:hypothetical protein
LKKNDLKFIKSIAKKVIVRNFCLDDKEFEELVSEEESDESED